MNPLPCSAILYRAMARKNWINRQSNGVLPTAFKLRPQEQGLSVDIDSPRSCHNALNKCFGVVSLHVGQVRDEELDVVVDEAPHADITGLPHEVENRTESERLASQLAKQSRIVPPDRYLDSV